MIGYLRLIHITLPEMNIAPEHELNMSSWDFASSQGRTGCSFRGGGGSISYVC